MIQKLEYSKYSAWSKLFHRNERQKLVNGRAPSVLLFLTEKLQNLTSCCLKVIEILIFLKSYTGLSVLKTKILEIFGKEKDLSFKWKTETGSYRSSFSPSFLNWKITGPYKFLLKLIWKIPFLEMLHWIICSRNKNIWNIWQEVGSFIQMEDKNLFIQQLLRSFFS